MKEHVEQEKEPEWRKTYWSFDGHGEEWVHRHPPKRPGSQEWGTACVASRGTAPTVPKEVRQQRSQREASWRERLLYVSERVHRTQASALPQLDRSRRPSLCQWACSTGLPVLAAAWVRVPVRSTWLVMQTVSLHSDQCSPDYEIRRPHPALAARPSIATASDRSAWTSHLFNTTYYFSIIFRIVH